jgi:hypothetical protein
MPLANRKTPMAPHRRAFSMADLITLLPPLKFRPVNLQIAVDLSETASASHFEQVFP